MPFNLISDSWIPLADPDGSRRQVRPAEVVSCVDGGALVAWPRADFSGATWEFLIGLTQVSSLRPASDDAWSQRWDAPPSLAEVDAAFAPLAEAFCLDGDGPRFLQDASAVDGVEKGFAALLIDSPGDNALTRNMDVFVKRGGASVACPACAAAALYTMQTYAPSGGQGHRTSLRGGGPLTTLVLGETPWQTVWSNILPDACLPEDSRVPGSVFPWMAPLRLSEDKGSETRPGQAPFLQAFWGQPRRFWLDFETVETGHCALCGTHSDRLIRRYYTKPRGVNYEGGWLHPLSPYNQEAGKPETATAVHGSPTGQDYRDWLGLAELRQDGDGSKGRQRSPAQAVTHFRKVRKRAKLRLWAFGYDTDNMKARGWNDSQMPLHPKMKRDSRFVDAVSRALQGVDLALWSLRRSLREAMFRDAKDSKAEFEAERAMVLDRTRQTFFALLDTLQARDEQDQPMDAEAVSPDLIKWHGVVARVTLDLFDETVQAVPLEIDKAEQLAKARQGLLGALWGTKMKAAMNLADLGKKAEAAS